MTTHYLRALFEPASVALVGATERPGKLAARVMENLLAAGFRGELFAVNPKYASVRGVPCVASVTQLPNAVDLAVIATPPATVPAIIEDCGKAGVPAAVIITAGFSETGAQGRALEQQVLEAARHHGVRIMGPNCLGIMRASIGLNATFARGNALPGSLALVSQSGAICTALLDWAQANGVGFSSVISMGGSSDVDFGEVVDYLASDEKTEHILLYMEGVRDGRGLVGSLRAGARLKPIIVMKAGRHPEGSRAAVSHTGAIVGDDDVFDAVVRRTGIVRVATAGELVAAALALASHVRPRGERLAVITNGGGPGVMAADRAAELGVPLASFRPQTLARLEAALPSNWSQGNPVDLIGDAGPERYRAALSACLEDPGVDGIVAILTPQAMTEPTAAARAVIGAASGAGKPVLACWMGEASVGEGRRILREAGISSFRLPETAVEAFAYLAQFYRNQRVLLEAPPPLVSQEPPDLEAARALVRRVLADGRTLLDTTESKEFLAAFRIPIARAVNAPDADAAVSASEAIGYPVVLKVRSPDITHKSDVGGVHLGLANAQAVRAAYRQILEAVTTRRPGARVLGVTVEPMVARAHARELMAGILRDTVFGPAITFGAGGIAIEVLHDRAVGLPPLNALLVEEMIRGTRVARMLEQFRNLPPVDRPALVDVLLRISEMACEIPEIRELDINPLIADETGVLALDARVVVAPVAPGARPYSHVAIHPYPATLETQLELAGGEKLALRPIRPEDAALEMEFVDALSPESKRLRFQSAIRRLTPTMLARFTQIDYDREMALVAIESRDGRDREVAVARYIRLPDGRTCEFAIVLADAWQGRGLGPRIMGRLIEVARGAGLGAMVGHVLASNEGMLRMCEHLGFAIERDPDDPLNRRALLAL
ncbi:MAG TPA: bifunctional acetate--CoA ligase family protein/GNAT family N-acetyltransferase [Usitatibacter sp.]|jgi:acetyltransferase|nr:bifunctional acetate--CoA ligase family protein/GNAT family N-acetyltransferase [Usitatibacter sp.]